MTLNAKALAITFALIWGGCVFLLALLNLVWPNYGLAFLGLVSSIYPGFHPGSFSAAVVGLLYAALDGGVCGLVVAWLYNTLGARAAKA